MQLRDKKVLMTGATGGIGKAMVAALLDQGCRLVLAGRNSLKLEHIAEELGGAKISVMALDLDNAQNLESQIQVIKDKHPDIDILMNCAGVNHFRACDHPSLDATAQLVRVNLTAVIQLTQLMLPMLRQRPAAAVINVGSTFGSIGYPGYTAYCASKFGLRGYTEALHRELADTAIEVYYLAPRATATAMNDAVVVAMNQELGNAMDEPVKVANDLVGALINDKQRYFVGWPEKLFVVINSVFSRLVDKSLLRQLPTINQYLKRGAQ